jgi:CheY-like chemotaxis protein
MERRPKILLVDDDVDLVKVMKGALESKAYEVIVAYDGKDGIEKAKKEKPDLVVLDILMPVADGFVFADQFRKDPSLAKTPVLALTSFSEAQGQPFAFEVEQYIRKPIKPKDLVAKVEEFLKRKPPQNNDARCQHLLAAAVTFLVSVRIERFKEVSNILWPKPSVTPWRDTVCSYSSCVTPPPQGVGMDVK